MISTVARSLIVRLHLASRFVGPAAFLRALVAETGRSTFAERRPLLRFVKGVKQKMHNSQKDGSG